MTIVPDTYHLIISMLFSSLSASSFPWGGFGLLVTYLNLYLVENSLNYNEEYWGPLSKTIVCGMQYLAKSPSTVQLLNLR